MRFVTLFAFVVGILMGAVMPSYGQSQWPAGKVRFTDAENLQQKFDAGDLGILADTTDTLTNKTIDDLSNTVSADFVKMPVRNETGGTLNLGDAVVIGSFSEGGFISRIVLADADAAATNMPAIGIISDLSISNNTEGMITLSGIIKTTGLDTSAFSVGDFLYVSTSGTTGNTLTDVKPTGGADVQPIAIVLRSNVNGQIVVIGSGQVIPKADDMVGSIDLGSGTIRGAVSIETFAITGTEAAAEGQWIYITAAVTRTLPAVSPTGQSLCYFSTGTNVVTIDPAASDPIVLNGGLLTGGVSIESPGAAGDFVCLLSDGTNWYTLGRSVAWIETP